jgi:hypothetical protein
VEKMTVLNVRIKAGDLRDDLRAEVTAWIASLGLEPSDLADQFLITHNGEEFVLHVSKRTRTESGAVILDRALGEPVSVPLVVPLGTRRRWPTVGIEAA